MSMILIEVFVSDADSNDFEDRFRRHFPRRSNDLTLVVLKGHLLLEEIVNRLLSALVREPKAIEGANLRFRQKLCMIRALLPEARGAGLYDAAEKLNTLRNKLAHHLDYPEIEAQVRDFLSLCEEPEDPEEPDNRDKLPLIRRLRVAIAFVCGALEAMGKGAAAVRDLQRR
jgi:hypothetical protein